jgi:16S rRNA (uracil1498-N3)-methyltransferase
MPRHTLLFEPDDLSDDRLVVAGPEAEHAAKSKRLRAGDELTAIDGDGLRLTCRVALVTKRSLELEVIERETIAQTSPAVHLGSATPKAQRLDKMIDMVSQAGAASWTPVETRLGVVDPGATKLDRMRRIVAESAKQCGRAHLMRLRAKTPLGRFLAAGEGRTLVVADGSGGAYRPTGAGAIRVAVGPEGGLVPDELDAARAAGAQIVSLGPHAMRIETACVVAVALVLASERAPAAT